MYKVVLPLRIQLSKNNWFSINLNSYRNAHYQLLNKTKILFKESIENQLEPLPYFNSCKLFYVLYPKTKHLQDIANICSIADKFFCDAMTEMGKWDDDNYEIVKEVNYRFGSIDKDNPRVEVFIIKGDKDMKIQLVEKEIAKAIKYFLANNIGLSLPDNVSITLSATRGALGTIADISLGEDDTEVKEVIKENKVESTPPEIGKDEDFVEEEEPIKEETPSPKSLFKHLKE